jgi:type III secretion protein U
MTEKTHEPSQQKLREARKNGQIPKSKLFTSAGVTVGAVTALLVTGEDTAQSVRQFLVQCFNAQNADTNALLLESVSVLAKSAGPVLAGAFAGALSTSVATAGLFINVSAVQPKFDSLNPVNGFKKLFSARQAMDLLKNLLVSLVLGFFVYQQLSAVAPLVFKSMTLSGQQSLGIIFKLLQPVALKGAVLLLALGVADWAWAKKRHLKDLMMSHEEVKQEHKNSEGDPHVKSKLKAERKKLAQGGSKRGVAKASAVVVNPTHIAVAIVYDEAENEVPYIVAKGQEDDATAIRAEATRLSIPIVRDVPLARALIHYDVGEEVPEELYRAAAAVLKVAFESKEHNA